MLFHSRKYPTPQERVAHGRALLAFLAKSVPRQDDPYAVLLKTEMDLLTGKADSYLLHEHFERVNEPVYFYQFAEQASSHGLQFLGEAHLAAMSSQELADDVRWVLDRLASNIVELEQYLDFLRNRTFRQTLLCRAGLQLNRQPTTERVLKLSIFSNVQPPDALDLSPDTQVTFANAVGRLRSSEPLMKAVLHLLARSYPRVWPVREVMEEAARLVEPQWASAQRIEVTAMSLVQSYVRGFVDFYAYTPRWADRLDERPLASPLARWQAETGNIATSLNHEVGQLTDLRRQVLLLCNGTRDRAALTKAVAELIRKGGILLSPEQQSAGRVEPLLDETLSWLLRACLFARAQ